jgi:hypothetical protein
MNLSKSQQVLKNKKKGQVIQTLTLKQKVKRHYTRRYDGVFTTSKAHNNFSFSFFANKFMSFSIYKMNVEESFVENLQKQSKDKQ